MKRYALVSIRNTSTEQVLRYLPGNYEKIGYAPHDPDAPGTDPTYYGPCIVIGGEDVAGWTMDDYVIPRLQSGLIAAREIDLSHPVMKTIVDRPHVTVGDVIDYLGQFDRDDHVALTADDARSSSDVLLYLALTRLELGMSA